MKKTILLLLFTIMFIPFNSLAQKDISGIYRDEAGRTIKIEGDNLYFIIPQPYDVRYFLIDTLLKANFKRIDDHFIELNTPQPNLVALESMKVTQSFDPNLQDSIRVAFSIPYSIGYLYINVYTRGNVVSASKTFSLTYSKDRKELCIPRNNIKSFIFDLGPANLSTKEIDGRYLGVIAFLPLVEHFPIETNMNSVLIEIPAIDDCYFERYVVKGEYARIKGRKIYWRGDVFAKSNK